MTAEPAPSRLSPSGRRLRFVSRRMLGRLLLACYCVTLFLIFDLLYSALTSGQERDRRARVFDPVFDHTLAPGFDGYDVWGEVRYRLVTNSLGFKDRTTRSVPLRGDSHRILLIGDSFTEAIGMSYDKSVGGLLNEDGQRRTRRTEVLNAGVASYSPSLYYRKIRHLLDTGLQFDEVVLLSDSSDVEDEATSYFCVDDDPRYRRHCTRPPDPAAAPAASRGTGDIFIDNFAVTNRVRVIAKRWIQNLLGNRRRAIARDHDRIGWSTPDPDPARYQPLGIEGGIERSVRNMGRLADLLDARRIPLTIVVYPWAQQIAQSNRDNRQVRIWREFCASRCKAFIDLFPAFFDAASRDPDWYERLYIVGDDHFSAAGNRMLYEELARRILP